MGLVISFLPKRNLQKHIFQDTQAQIKMMVVQLRAQLCPPQEKRTGPCRLIGPTGRPATFTWAPERPLEAMTCSHRVRGSCIRGTITSEALEAHGGLTSAGLAWDLHASSTRKAITSEALEVHGGLTSVDLHASCTRKTITCEALEVHGGLTSVGPPWDLHASCIGKTITSGALEVHGGQGRLGGL